MSDFLFGVNLEDTEILVKKGKTEEERDAEQEGIQ